MPKFRWLTFVMWFHDWRATVWWARKVRAEILCAEAEDAFAQVMVHFHCKQTNVIREALGLQLARPLP